MPAFYSIPEKRSARKRMPLFIFGDHASNYIPPELDNLGLSGDDLTRHIAWDIGTDRLVRGLCARLKCAGQVAGMSRLVIDYNRDPDAPGLIPEVSDGTIVPGNRNVSQAEKNRRLKDYHAPYHAALRAALKRNDDPLIVSMHSFTDKPKTGEWRMTEIGLLHKGDLETSLRAQEQLMRTGRNFTIGMNTPYSAFVLNYTVDADVMPTGLRHLTFEIRQDLMDTDAKVDDMTEVIAQVLKPLI